MANSACFSEKCQKPDIRLDTNGQTEMKSRILALVMFLAIQISANSQNPSPPSWHSYDTVPGQRYGTRSDSPASLLLNRMLEMVEGVFVSQLSILSPT